MQTRSQTRSITLSQQPVANDRSSNARNYNARSSNATTSTNNSRPKRNVPTVNYAEYSDPEDATLFEPKPRNTRALEPKYSVDIDFDESSRAWRANKRLIGQCHFAYRTPEKDNIRKEVIEHVERRSSRLANKTPVSFAEFA